MTTGPHDWHYVVNPPLGGFETGFGLWTPSGEDALWQTTPGGAYWSGIIGELGVQFRVVVASALGQGAGDFLYDDPTSLYDTATYSTNDITWFNLTPLVRHVRTNRGKQHLGQQFNAGTLTLTLSNENGVFNPQRAVTVIGGQTIRPGRLVGVQSKLTTDAEDQWETLWLGRIDSLGDVYVDAAHDVLSTWSCSGLFTLLNADAPPALEAPDPVTAGQTTGERLEYIWALEGYSTNFLDAEVGQHTMQATTFPGSRLEQCQAAEAAEGGYFFESRDGVLTFRDRSWLDNPVEKLEIGTLDSDLKVLDVQTSWDSVRIINSVSFQAEGGLAQQAVNPTSQALYGRRWVTRTDLQNDNDVQVFALAEQAVERNAFDNLRIDEIEVWASTIDVVKDLLTIEIGDVVRVQVTTALGWDYTVIAWVMGVSHEVMHTDWKVRLRLDDTNRGNPVLAGAYSTAYSSAYNVKEE